MAQDSEVCELTLTPVIFAGAPESRGPLFAESDATWTRLDESHTLENSRIASENGIKEVSNGSMDPRPQQLGLGSSQVLEEQQVALVLRDSHFSRAQTSQKLLPKIQNELGESLAVVAFCQ